MSTWKETRRQTSMLRNFRLEHKFCCFHEAEEIMLNISNSILRSSKRVALTRLASINYKQCASFGTVEKKGSVMDAWKQSCYYDMDYTISDEEKVFDAVKKFSAFDVGALVTTNKAGKFSIELGTYRENA